VAVRVAVAVGVNVAVGVEVKVGVNVGVALGATTVRAGTGSPTPPALETAGRKIWETRLGACVAASIAAPVTPEPGRKPARTRKTMRIPVRLYFQK
jgi:hypothetical protein